MLAVIVTFGLLFAGAVLAAGWLHWRGLARFGRRGPAWGLGTMAIGAMQVVAWLLLPGPPDLWLRPLIALAAAAVTVLLVLRRRSA